MFLVSYLVPVCDIPYRVLLVNFDFSVYPLDQCAMVLVVICLVLSAPTQLLIVIGATVPGLTSFTLPRLGHSSEWICDSLKIGLDNIVLAQSSKQSHSGEYRETIEHKR